MGQRRVGAGLRVLELGGHHEAAVSHEPGLMVPSFSWVLLFSSYNCNFGVMFWASCSSIASTDEFSKQF